MTLINAQVEFLNYLENWLKTLSADELKKVVSQPEEVAIISVDMINGFCYEGALASPRVAGIVQPIRELFLNVWSLGVRNILLIQDMHEPDSVEFAQFPPHCLRGTKESETVDEFKSLSFFDKMLVFPKNSIHSGLKTGLQSWIDMHPEVKTYIVVGDCTDLCTYQLAMHMRLDANARQLQRRVLAPADCIQTYDMPVNVAQQIGALPHPGDLMHAVFLYHMAINGIEVVRSLEAK